MENDKGLTVFGWVLGPLEVEYAAWPTGGYQGWVVQPGTTKIPWSALYGL